MDTGSSRLPSRFMKIITDPQADRLEIPHEFIKRHGHILPSRVFLKVPGGPAIEAELVQCSLGKTWIKKGWSEFKQCCSIAVGHFIVFDYNMKDEFTFLIFDMSALEINYPMFQDNGINSNSSSVLRRTTTEIQDETGEKDQDVTDKKSSYVCGCSFANCFMKTRIQSETECLADLNGSQLPVSLDSNYPMVQDNELDTNSSHVLRRRTKTENQDETAEKCSPCCEKDQNSKFSLRNIREKRKPGCSTDEKCDQGAGVKFLTNVKMEKDVMEETSTAYRKAAAFSTRLKNPFHIEVMKQSTAFYGFLLNLPISFARQNVPREGNNAIMVTFRGKQWPVNCIRKTDRAYLSGGWRAFAKDNGLKLGDVCVFEVANTRNKIVWNATVFRSE